MPSQHPKRRAKIRVDAPAKPLASWLGEAAVTGQLPLEKQLLSTTSRACYQVDVRALAWLAAAFSFDLGATLEQPEVLFLATLGGWTPGKAKPGKAALGKGLARLSHHLVLEQLARKPAKAASLRCLTHDLLRS